MPDITLEDVTRLRLKPGDTLVLRTSSELPPHQLEQVQDEMRHAFPQHQTVVLHGDVDLEVVSGGDSA